MSYNNLPQYLQHPPGGLHGLCEPDHPAQLHLAEAVDGDGVHLLLNQDPQRCLQQEHPHLHH